MGEYLQAHQSSSGHSFQEIHVHRPAVQKVALPAAYRRAVLALKVVHHRAAHLRGVLPLAEV